MYSSLPMYVRRDFKRMHGEIVDAASMEGIVRTLANFDEVITRQGKVAVCDAWLLKHITRENSIRRAISRIQEARPTFEGTFHRRGDFVLFKGKAS